MLGRVESVKNEETDVMKRSSTVSSLHARNSFILRHLNIDVKVVTKKRGHSENPSLIDSVNFPETASIKSQNTPLKILNRQISIIK